MPLLRPARLALLAVLQFPARGPNPPYLAPRSDAEPDREWEGTDVRTPSAWLTGSWKSLLLIVLLIIVLVLGFVAFLWLMGALLVP